MLRHQMKKKEASKAKEAKKKRRRWRYEGQEEGIKQTLKSGFHFIEDESIQSERYLLIVDKIKFYCQKTHKTNEREKGWGG